MDHARKLGKPDKSTIWTKRRSPPSLISDKPLLKDEELTEDKRLANWQKWLTDRKKLCKHYSRRTDRDHQDLLINTPDSFRRNVEMKELMAITVGLANKKKPDKYRGDPGFWVTPDILSKRGNPDLPDISITLTKKQLNAIPEVERITLPELTQQEKGLLSQKQPTPLWKRSGNSKILAPKLTRQIKSFEAKESELKRLAIKGTRLGQRKSDSPKVPIITFTGANTFDDKGDQNLRPEDAIVLKIQEREIKLIKAESKKESSRKSLNDITWSLIFKSSGSNITENTIRLENLGTSTITYHWRYGSLGTSLIPQNLRNSSFFFNKNKNIILPGQITILRVWFRSSVSCSSTEFWTLLTDPNLCREHLVFRFWGCCSPCAEIFNITNGNFEQDSNSIEQYLDRRIRDTKIQEIIHEILDNVQEKRVPSPAYGSLFLEREIFQTKNSLYFYHPELVQQLRIIYDNSTSHDSPSWSLSLNELRGVLMQLKKPEVRNEALVNFSKLCRNCLETSLYNPIGNTKRSMVYNLFCSFANKFEREHEWVLMESSQGSNTDKIKSELQRDTPSSTSVSKNSHGSLTPHRNSKKIRKTASKSSLSITNRETVKQTLENEHVGKSFLYKEVFYMRIRAMLMDTIVGICGVVDTVNNLEDLGK